MRVNQNPSVKNHVATPWLSINYSFVKLSKWNLFIHSCLSNLMLDLCGESCKRWQNVPTNQPASRVITIQWETSTNSRLKSMFASGWVEYLLFETHSDSDLTMTDRRTRDSSAAMQALNANSELLGEDNSKPTSSRIFSSAETQQWFHDLDPR